MRVWIFRSTWMFVVGGFAIMPLTEAAAAIPLARLDIPLSSSPAPAQQAKQPAESTSAAGQDTNRARLRAPSAPAFPGGASASPRRSDSQVPAIQQPLQAPDSGVNAAAEITEPPALEAPRGLALPVPTDERPTLLLRPSRRAAESPRFENRPTIDLEVSDDVDDSNGPSGIDGLPNALERTPLPRPTVSVPEAEDESDVDEVPDSGGPASVRKKRKGIIARLLGRDERIPPAPAAVRRDRVREQPDTDAVEDAAFQSRVERGIRASTGRHLRDLDVTVKGRKVRIRATADRLWNKRGVRRAIEELPMLSGREVDIVVD